MTLPLCDTGFLNCSQIMGQAVVGMTNDTTGSLFITFSLVMLFIVALAGIFRIQIEWTLLIVMPLLLGLMSYYQDFITFGGIIFLYLAILITKNFFIK